MTTIRPATAADLPDLVSMGRRFLAALYVGRLQDAPNRLDALARQLVADENSLVLVSEDQAGVGGMIAMMCYEHPMSGDAMAVEMFWWVEPDRRGDGMRLFRRARAWAKARGARVIQMIAPMANPDVAVMYDRLGFVPVETTYQRSL